jgi:diguanylate cyclase (GGDEF)-like protein/PAS domain S-box-containing protein
MHQNKYARKLTRFALALALANLAFLAVLLTAGWLIARSSRQGDEATAVETAQNMAAGLASEIGAEIHLIDNALATVALAHRSAPTDASRLVILARTLQEQRALLTGVDSLRVAGADGVVVLGLEPAEQGARIADRDYFIAARERDGLVVSEPLQGRIIRQWGIVLARRLVDDEGRFDGVVYAYLSSERFAARFRAINVGESGAVSLRSAGLRLVARHSAQDPDPQKALGTANVSRELREALDRNAAQGWFLSATALDGIERISAYHRVPDHGLTVLAGLATRDFLAPWRRDVNASVVLLLVAAASIVGVSIALFRQRRRHLEAELRIAELMQVQHLMLDNELIGIVRTRGRQTVWKNKALDDIFGYSGDELLRTPSRLLYFDDESHRRVGREGYDQLRSTGRYRTQVAMRRKDGSPVWIDLSGTPVSGDESMWMFVDITALKASEARLEQLAHHDPLTGLANRASFVERLQQELAEAARRGSRTAVAYLDLDGFKPINDRLGHAAGDAVLAEVGRRVLASVRPQDFAARLGGDEFAVVLTGIESTRQAHAIVGRLLAALSTPIAVGPERVTIGASLGVAVAPDDAADAAALTDLADAAMYAAKRGRKAGAAREAETPALAD